MSLVRESSQDEGAANGAHLRMAITSRVLNRCGYTLWAVHLVGMLLLPCLLPIRLTDALRRRSGGKPGSSGGSSGGNGNGPGGDEAAGLAFAVLRTVAAPLLALQDMSTMGIPWLLQVGCVPHVNARAQPLFKLDFCHAEHVSRPRQLSPFECSSPSHAPNLVSVGQNHWAGPKHA